MNEAINAVGDAAPVIAICLFALPSYLGVFKQKGLLRGLLILATLGLLAIGLDTLAVKSGLPYGRFSYADSLGYKVFGVTPWTIGLVFPPVLLASFWMASKITKGSGRVFLTAGFLLFIAIVLSPAIVKLQLWQSEAGGQFYGVPIANLAGLGVTGLISAWVLIRLWGKNNEVKASIAYSGLAILLFWTGVNIGIEQWLPVGAGTLASLAVLLVLVLEKKQLKVEKAH